MTNRHGFTIVEVLVAVMVLSVGIMGLVTTAGLVTRMIGQGHRYTEASTLASERFEILRAETCPAVGSDSDPRGAFTVTWTVTDIGGGRGREITVRVTSPTPRGPRTDVFTTTKVCQ